MDEALLDRIEQYYDTAPRSAADVEELGPFTVFAGTGAWPYYARPRLGTRARFEAADVGRVRARQRALGLPEAFEWVEEVTPQLAPAIEEAGLEVRRHPLLVLGEPLAAPDVEGIRVRVVGPRDAAIPAAQAAIRIGFDDGTTAVGTVGAVHRDAAAASADPGADSFLRERIAVGDVSLAVAEDATGPVGGGTAIPRGAVAELTGIATLPAARRRGVGLAVTAALVAEVRRRGVDVVFLTAAGDDVARVYERAGFRRFATACVAEA